MIKQYKPDLIEQGAFKTLNEGATANGIVLAYANQTHYQPVAPYATLSIDSRVPQGQVDRIRLDDTGVMALYGTRTGSGTILCVGDTAGDMADTMVNWLTTSSASYANTRNGVVIHSATAVPMQPERIDNQEWQQVCAVDFQYRCGVVYDDNVGLIAIVNVGCKVGKANGVFELYTSGDPTVSVWVDPVPAAPPGLYPLPRKHVRGATALATEYTSLTPDIVQLEQPPGQTVHVRYIKPGVGRLRYEVELTDHRVLTTYADIVVTD